ncbi:hypothetical protein [Vannielia litorea]|uniref:hypothetical protein n=1 Tax=Vannielia litorea TaxID=1217970 RepID=UPI001C95F6C4|nr:hypothetical protein [Vannielia litorea]MBY6047535.1 hypothetical protein [Vannielia litorea]MBY6074949.1 hypothetical protein [Vannielia litorea]
MGQHGTVEGFFRDNPEDSGACLAEWLVGQSQEVWAHVIRGLEGQGHTPEGRALEWMVGRRELDRSNAVRLFWSLFDSEVWMGTREDARLAAAMERLVERFEAGFYTVQALEITRAEAFCFRHRLRRVVRRARHEGWQEGAAVCSVPEAFVRPMKGLPVAEQPGLHPSRSLTGEARRVAEALGAGLLAAGRGVMAARRREAWRGWCKLRTLQGFGVAMLAAMGAGSWMFLTQDMRQMLAMVGY